jgi:hypothetical protein
VKLFLVIIENIASSGGDGGQTDDSEAAKAIKGNLHSLMH